MTTAAAVSLLAVGLMATPTLAGGSSTFFVAPGGSDANNCRSDEKPCKTITHAISLASPKDRIEVDGGTYKEQVVIAKKLRLRGDEATIDAAGTNTIGILIQGAGAAGSSVSGFTVRHATFEGILARSTSHVTIEDNTVKDNNLGFAAQAVGECHPPSPTIPGDCGEGLHLWSVTDSKVLDNWVTNNAGGILLTDEFGPTARNLISRNTVVNNMFDCGITIAGHNPTAFTGGVLYPAAAGIYSNTISHNVSNRNGLKGEGAGILLAGAGTGTAVYNNTVLDNRASGNSLAGLTLHRHAPASYLGGNVIKGNRFTNDNLGGDPDFGVFQTAGIVIGSNGLLSGTVVEGNFIEDVHFGIWTQGVPPIAVSANHFDDVDIPVSQH